VFLLKFLENERLSEPAGESLREPELY